MPILVLKLCSWAMWITMTASATPSECIKVHRVYLSSTTSPSTSLIQMRHLPFSEISLMLQHWCRLYLLRRLPLPPLAHLSRSAAEISSTLKQCYPLYPSRRITPLSAHPPCSTPHPSRLRLHLPKRRPLVPLVAPDTSAPHAARHIAGCWTCSDTPKNTTPARSALIALLRAARIPVRRGF